MKKKHLVFSFKQFDVDQTAASMKINTDGVLLGAIAEKRGRLTHILDIGTGTGVIALMLAQRFPEIEIIGIEPDVTACALAEKNFKASPFSLKPTAVCVCFENFDAPDHSFDLIVSNPPFFINALQNPDQRKSAARHTSFDFFKDLLIKVDRLLRDDGSLQLILPTELAKLVVVWASQHTTLICSATTAIRSYADQPVIRQLITLSRLNMMEKIKESEVILYKSSGIYTQQYKDLLTDFFLKF